MLACATLSSLGCEGPSAEQSGETVKMRIQFERTGGFTGIPVSTTVDVDSLSPDEEAEVRKLVGEAGFFDLPAEVGAPSSRGADQFQYSVTIEEGDRRHIVRTGDGSAPKALRPLLDWLSAAAQKTRRTKKDE